MATILVVEDECDQAKLVANWLTKQGHTVDVLTDGGEALSCLKINKDRYGLIVLDIMLPGASGTDICRSYRSSLGTSPVLMLTARNSIEEKEIAFDLGADDYITKPFQLRELSVRVNALLRRGPLMADSALRFGDIVLDPKERKVTKCGAMVQLRPREFQLLEFLIKHPNQTFSAKEIIDNVWDPASDALNDTVRGHINRLRKKLDDPGKPSLIANVYGFGYKLESGS